VLRFAGVPFAAPPVGERRFGAAERPEAWSGVRPALEFGSVSVQAKGPPSGDGLFSSFPVSEDCLTLNLWTPELGAVGLPVILYLHAGGLVALSGAEPLWHGEAFARDGVVLVTINYRLGALGYLHLDDLVPGARETSCNGLSDQIAALQWVAENISAFGGDPDRVTVMGQSAGGWSVSTLLASPLAKGLFRRAIVQSGGGNHVFSRESGTRLAQKFLELAGVRPDLDELRAVPVERLYQAQEAVQRVFGGGSPEAIDLLGEDANLLMSFLPVVGADALPDVPLRAVAAGAGGDVDLLAGSCQDEYGMYRLVGGAYTEEQMLENARRVLAGAGRSAGAAERLYGGNRPGTDAALVAEAIETDRFFRLPVVRVAEGHSRSRGRTYLYEFHYRDSEYGSAHCIELPFVFDKPHHPLAKAMMPSGTPNDLIIGCHEAWVSFAEHGRPDSPNLPAWPEYDLTSRETMIFDHPTCHVQQDPRGDERALWDGVL
jgi:para-nitrobenzyl esterase